MDQRKKISRISHPTTYNAFASKRVMAQYVGVNCRPDVCAAVQLIAPGGDRVTKEEYLTMNRVIIHLKSYPRFGLTFVFVDIKSSRLALFTDASFGNARNDKSQLGYLIVMADPNNNENIIHYASSRCRCVTWSVISCEIHALVLGFETAHTMQHLIEVITGIRPGIEAYLHSKNVFDVIANQDITPENLLQIDISALRESYSRLELSIIAWIPRSTNPADSLTKMRTMR